MNCEGESELSGRPPTSGSNPIDIFDPPDGTSAGLGEVLIQSGCKINASGSIDTVNFPGLSNKLQRVWARVTGGEGSSTEVEGTVAGNNWSVSGIPEARWNSAGLIQTVTVRCQFNIPLPNIISNNKQFLARTGDSSCQYYSSAIGTGLLPIQEVMPRYFRVTAEFGEPQCFGVMLASLLSQGNLVLAFDPRVSTPECAVWRDIGLPTGVGGWMLRVARMSHCCYEARLSIQPSTETCILPATVLLTRNWCFRKRTLFHGSFRTEFSSSDVTLIVEPS